jgi:hypothetical protein
MKQLRRLILVCGVSISGVPLACTGSSVDRQSAPPSRDGQPAFVGKIWNSTDSSAAPGTLRIFLSDGTLMMHSCVETYRLARWMSIDDRRIAWQEEGARIEAEIVRVTSDELQLRLRLASEVKDEHYRLAQVPYVCPDMRQNPPTPTSASRVR